MSFSSSISLRRNYSTFFLIITLSILFLTTSYITYTYYSFQKNLQAKLETAADNMKKELERGFDDNKAILKYLGEIIIKTNISENYDSLKDLLISTGELNIRSLATSFVSWATPEGYIAVSGRHGILHNKDRRSIISRSYFKSAREYPGTLQFSEATKSVFSTSPVLPTILGVQDQSGKFLGYLTLGLRLREIIKQLKKIINDSDIKFIVIDKDLNLAISSEESIETCFASNSSHLKESLKNKHSFRCYFPQVDINFKVLIPFDQYPFQVITGYHQGKSYRALIRDISPGILGLLLAVIGMFLLNLLKSKIISPITQLYNTCLKLSTGEKVGKFPKFKIQEIDKLSEGLSLLSVMFEENKKTQKKLENAREITSLSDSAREKHTYLIFNTILEYTNEIKICLLSLYEMMNTAKNERLIKLLNNVNKKTDDILNAVYADNEKTLVDINSLVQECKTIYLKEAFKLSIIINTHLETQLPLYYGDHLKFKQIILSIMGKCLESTLNNEKIEITTQSLFKDHQIYIQIIFVDNGLPEDKIRRVNQILGYIKGTLNILDLEIIQQIIQEEGGIFESSPSEKIGRRYVITLPIDSTLQIPDEIKTETDNIIQFKALKSEKLSF